jgi:hypothetical protein
MQGEHSSKHTRTDREGTAMPKVMVYLMKRYDIMTDETRVRPKMATRKRAEELKCEVIEGSGIEIDASQLDHDEEYTPRDFNP